MTTAQSDNVVALFEFLLEELEIELALITQTGEQQLAGGNYDQARDAVDVASSITAFRDDVLALRHRWDDLATRLKERAPQLDHATEHPLPEPLNRGPRTPLDAFYDPILHALKKLGGSAQADDVLAEVGAAVDAALNDFDRQPMIPGTETPRWRNTVQWARQAMVRDGLLKDNSPPQVWELTDTGAWRQAHAELRIGRD